MNLETNNKIQKKGITLVIPNPCGNIKETKMKNSGVEWIGEIPDEWEVSKIGQLYEERRTKVSDTVYPPLSVTMQGILPQLENAAKSDAHDDRKLVLKGDFAINSRSDRRGSCGISNFNGSVSLINTVLHPKTEMNPIYYNWLFHSFRFSDEYYKNGHGIVDDLWTTSWSEMKKIFIPLPPKETQQRIATYLDKKCSKIEETIQNQQLVIEKLKDYKQSLITEAVTGKVKIVNGKACGEYESYKDSGVEWIGKIPSEWISTKISYLTTKIGSGKTPNGGAAIYRDEGILFIRSQNVYNEGLLLNEPMFISDEIDDDMKGTRLVHNDVLLNITGGSIGRCCIYEEKFGRANVNQHVCIIRVIPEKILPKFMQLFWISKIGEISIDIYQTGGNREGMSGDAISKTFIPLPTMDEQKEITYFLDKKCSAIDTAIEQKQELIVKLTEYKKSLIYECVTGKKEI